MSGADGDQAAVTGRGSSLGSWLRGLREQALLTQEELAARSGLSVGTIRGVETGRIRRPRGGSLRQLADALGLDGPDRQALLDAGRDQQGDACPPMGRPRQLPADVAAFTGRERELSLLERELAAGEAGPVAVAAIHGTGGIGKSALAIHAAHRLAGRYPDGQLYVDLHGATAGLAPLAPLEVLGRFLRALGVPPSTIPTEVDEAAARFRSELAGRRMLVVLDNARDAAQVRPLLPATADCAVMITSRRALSSLEGARHLHLDVLPEPEAIELLARLAGAGRVAAEPWAAAEVVRWCGGLPLALRIAGARLAARPAWPVRLLAERLADARRRLDELELAEVGVRASFAVSRQELAASTDPGDRAAARAFELLGILDGPDVGVPVAARLLDCSEARAEGALERLVDANLLQTPSPGRYRLHDLLRLYARELATQHTEAVRAVALTRALGFYVATAWGALALLRPGDFRLAYADDRWSKDGLELADEAAALGWLETERANLLAAVGQAAATPKVPGELAVQLVHGMFGLFLVRNHWQDWVRVGQIALGVARRIGDRTAQALTQNDIGVASWRQGHDEQALTGLQESLALFRELGDRHGQATSLSNLGLVHGRQGQDDQALACQQEGLALYRELGDRHGQAASLSNLGLVYGRLGRYEQALACQQQSLALFRELGERHGQAVALGNLGEIHGRLGRYEQALACQRESLALFRELGDRWSQAFILHDLGVVCQRQCRHEQALAFLEESLTIRRELDDPHGEAESLRELGVVLRKLGRHGEARDAWSQALAIFEKLQAPGAARVRALLAEGRTGPEQIDT